MFWYIPVYSFAEWTVIIYIYIYIQSKKQQQQQQKKIETRDTLYVNLIKQYPCLYIQEFIILDIFL